MSSALAPARFTMLLLMIFAGVAASLAVVGIYGVMSHAVTERTHEIGVAHGAWSAGLRRAQDDSGLRLQADRARSGRRPYRSVSAHAFDGGPAVQRERTDLATFVVIPAILAGVAVGACFAPARRAARVDPMVALRYE